MSTFNENNIQDAKSKLLAHLNLLILDPIPSKIIHRSKTIGSPRKSIKTLSLREGTIRRGLFLNLALWLRERCPREAFRQYSFNRDLWYYLPINYDCLL